MYLYNYFKVLLKDSFSPVLRNIAIKNGVEYTRELERNVFSRGLAETAEYIKKNFNVKINKLKLWRDFIKERKRLCSNSRGSGFSRIINLTQS